MKAIDLSTTAATLAEILDLAGEDNVILQTAEGRKFVLAEIDDFADEVERTRRNESLTQMLNARSNETATLTLSQVREQLRSRKPGQKKGRNGRKGGAQPKR
jgi:hypothetical protein